MADAALAERYYLDLAAAFIRGRLGLGTDLASEALFERGLAAGLKLHKFKRNAELPRVQKALGMLRALAPTSLLDVGSGRGTFLWPLLDTFPAIEVVAIDASDVRAKDLQAARRGGLARLTAHHMDAEQLDLAADSVDGATVLEVLEHVADPAATASQVVRVVRRFVVASVPSKADDNPEHVRLFTPASLERLWLAAGARRVKLEYVPGHMLALVHV
jgi:ubiquinone/menaquinone biosynthesis C-methylase UbiE